MNKKGFTLFEMLCCVALMGFVLTLGLYTSKDTFGAAVDNLNKVNDNEIHEAARTYAATGYKKFNDLGYICVTVSELVDYGFLKDVSDDYKDKIVKVERDNEKKVITNIDYVDICE